MIPYKPRHAPSSLVEKKLRAWNTIVIRNIEKKKAGLPCEYVITDTNWLRRLIDEEKISDETHDACIGVSAAGGYSYSTKGKDSNLEDELDEIFESLPEV